MSKYEKLDAAIIKAIGNGRSEFSALNGGDVTSEAKAIAIFENSGLSGRDCIPAWRVVDRRLQALRKAGKIRFARGSRAVGGGWVLA